MGSHSDVKSATHTVFARHGAIGQRCADDINAVWSRLGRGSCIATPELAVPPRCDCCIAGCCWRPAVSRISFSICQTAAKRREFTRGRNFRTVWFSLGSRLVSNLFSRFAVRQAWRPCRNRHVLRPHHTWCPGLTLPERLSSERFWNLHGEVC